MLIVTRMHRVLCDGVVVGDGFFRRVRRELHTSLQCACRMVWVALWRQIDEDKKKEGSMTCQVLQRTLDLFHLLSRRLHRERG